MAYSRDGNPTREWVERIAGWGSHSSGGKHQAAKRVTGRLAGSLPTFETARPVPSALSKRVSSGLLPSFWPLRRLEQAGLA
jgi:hypothetical protein